MYYDVLLKRPILSSFFLFRILKRKFNFEEHTMSVHTLKFKQILNLRRAEVCEKIRNIMTLYLIASSFGPLAYTALLQNTWLRATTKQYHQNTSKRFVNDLLRVFCSTYVYAVVDDMNINQSNKTILKHLQRYLARHSCMQENALFIYLVKKLLKGQDDVFIRLIPPTLLLSK